MTEEVPSASGMPECNGSVTLKKGPLQVVGEIAKSVGMVPCTNAEMRPDDAPPAEENRGENRNSLAEDIVHGDFDEEKQCKEKQEENDGTVQQGSADIQDTGTDGQESEEGPGSEGLPAGSREPVMGMAASTVVEAAETLAASTDGRGNATEEEEEEVEEEEDDDEEEDTEEDDVQVIEIKKENSKASHLKQYDSGKEASPLTTPGCNSPVEKPGEQLSLGKKNDISRHSYSRYNTISYRRIRKGNTKQRIDEFESMMHL
ncbi:ermin isoform X1 [Pezoporus wallicus]|uniref:ermin isoform X1 n=1 Tax=Pezoporus wallicus TaxID=35540 RepID=UPI00254FD39D|nr:ermin isoform X1 [Pezoporus wallicus]